MSNRELSVLDHFHTPPRRMREASGVSQFLELDLCDSGRRVTGVIVAEVTQSPWLEARNEGALKDYILAIGGGRPRTMDLWMGEWMQPGELRRTSPIPTGHLEPLFIRTLPGITVWQVRYS